MWFNARQQREAFTGHIHDSATGLTYMQARYYDPVIGRFLSHDPVGFAQGGPGYFNRYAYAFNDPVNHWDPNGEEVLGFGASGGFATPKGGFVIGFEISYDSSSRLVSVSGNFGPRIGARARAEAYVFAAPSTENGSSLTVSHTAVAGASAEGGIGPLKGELGISAELGAELECSAEAPLGEMSLIANIDPTANATTSGISVNEDGRVQLTLGGGIGGDAGLDAAAKINIDLDDVDRLVDVIEN